MESEGECESWVHGLEIGESEIERAKTGAVRIEGRRHAKVATRIRVKSRIEEKLGGGCVVAVGVVVMGVSGGVLEFWRKVQCWWAVG